MNKTKISNKVKSLALLCLYTTIGLGTATIVSSCDKDKQEENTNPKTDLNNDCGKHDDEKHDDDEKKALKSQIDTLMQNNNILVKDKDSIIKDKDSLSEKCMKQEMVLDVSKFLVELHKLYNFKLIASAKDDDPEDLDVQDILPIDEIIYNVETLLSKELEGKNVLNHDVIFQTIYSIIEKKVTPLFVKNDKKEYTNGFVILTHRSDGTDVTVDHSIQRGDDEELKFTIPVLIANANVNVVEEDKITEENILVKLKDGSNSIETVFKGLFDKYTTHTKMNK